MMAVLDEMRRETVQLEPLAHEVREPRHDTTPTRVHSPLSRTCIRAPT